MDSPPKLSGETLIVHHIPLVHCQIPDRQCCGSVKRASTFCQSDLGLTRTTSLPEQDVQQKEALVYSSLIQTSSGSGRGSFVSDSSSFSSSNNSEEPSSQSKSRDPVAKANQQRHNPFLLNSEEEVEDNSLDGYLEDSSFHLHGNSNTHTGKQSSFHLHDLTFAPEPFLLHNGVGVAHKTWNCVAGRPVIAEGQGVGETNHAANNVTAVSKNAERPSECLDIMGYDCQRRHGSSGSTLSMDCGEQEWNASPPDDEDQLRNGQRSRACSCCSSSDFPLASSSQRCHCCFYSFSDPSEMTDQQMGYISDSSCNSSDGVLVNFSAIYNKMNNGGPSKPLNLNSGDQSCASSVCSHLEAGGAFYLDLHTSPTEPREDSCQEQGSKTCSCHHKHQQQQQSPQGLDANCNSYHLHCGGGPCLSEGSDLTSCFQSQARLVVATQNYYKLVTCDLSSQSSPSPAGSSITSCSEEHTKSSPSQPTEYYLFQKPEDNQEVMKEEQPEKEVEEEEHTQGSEMSRNVIEGQVYVNVSPPNMSSGRPRSRSYDRNLDKSPSSRLGTLERMLSCPVKLSESASHCSSSHRSSPPRRVTSFAEIARSKKKSSSVGGGSPPLRTSTDSSSLEFSPVGELQLPRHTGESHSLPPMPFVRCYSQGSCDLITSSGGGNPLQQGPPRPLCDSPRSARETRAKAEGGASEGNPLMRYSKEQRPTTLPIQPFVFQHQLSKQPSKLRPLLSDYVSQMYSRPSGQPATDRGSQREEEHRTRRAAPETVRLSPLGSYSPVRNWAPSSETCSTCTPTPDKGLSSSQPRRSHSCPLSAGLLPIRPSAATVQPAMASQTRDQNWEGSKQQQQQQQQATQPLSKDTAVSGSCLHRNSLPTLSTDGFSPLGHLEPQQRSRSSDGVQTSNVLSNELARTPNAHRLAAHHLSPQALKWREYRRKNPLGLERALAAQLTGSLDTRKPDSRLARRNVFDFPASAIHSHSRLNGQSVKQLQNYYSDFFPDYFSLAEKPPDEFCLSPDATTESISIDLLQKKCLVKAINTAVDLIVAHFGTSRDPGVKAKLGNSSVSPNVGHLILKYLCPALREVLLDGLKAYVLDMIIGQRRNMPWSLVEASTQLGPSTKVLHGLHSKISQYSELTNHSMRFNAFVFGLLNIRSLEFWFNHLYTHEDIVAAHYHPWGFLPLSQGVCQPLFEELLLLLQPLSLLPFDLDLLFEHRLLQKGHEQLRRKEQLCSAGQGLEQSVRSTFQLMRGWGVGSAREGAPESRREGAGSERAELKDTEASPSRTERERRKGFTATGEESLRDPGASCKGEGQPKAAGERPKAAGRESWWEREEGERERRKENETEQQQMPEGVRQKDRQAGWWYQLMQSSQVYIENSNGGSKFIKWEKRRKPAGEANGSHHQGCNTRLGGGGGGAALDTGGRQARPPLREGVVEGAEAVLEARRELSSEEKGKPSWMGSPPESVLHELNQSKNKESEKQAGEKNAPQGQDSPEGLQGLRWGRLFGAGVGSPVKTQRTEQQPARTQKSRLPSGWLSLDKSVLDLMAQTMGAGKRKDTPPLEHASPPVGEQGPEQQQEAQVPKQQAPWEVRALCHHIATEPGQLSFNKGDVLRVLGRAEPEWLHCMLGELSGLVPIIYVTQPEKDSN
ncbi:AP-4 complex accessory subunit RUSC2-like isoform X2 [Acipenser ruthenus]|uniref:AP-4 complex accessory subunit RUSC2-like isoform X2 n=1 Tax=Acipenser ruthenus TaxID=7906 RepID=UPI002741E20E|nr:AP-4 complex accessory subunit RUSC2-like isoform X2 [Acipenser ruthenus]